MPTGRQRGRHLRLVVQAHLLLQPPDRRRCAGGRRRRLARDARPARGGTASRRTCRPPRTRIRSTVGLGGPTSPFFIFRRQFAAAAAAAAALASPMRTALPPPRRPPLRSPRARPIAPSCYPRLRAPLPSRIRLPLGPHPHFHPQHGHQFSRLYHATHVGRSTAAPPRTDSCRGSIPSVLPLPPPAHCAPLSRRGRTRPDTAIRPRPSSVLPVPRTSPVALRLPLASRRPATPPPLPALPCHHDPREHQPAEQAGQQSEQYP